MNSGTIHSFLKGKSILVIGTTGFLAKVFVEKILRIQPEIQQLYLLVRASNNDLASQRLQNEVFQTDLFGLLRDKLGQEFDSFISKKVTAIAGDVSVQNLGLKDENLNLFQEIDLIVNFAATTKFDERFDISMGVNTMGPLHVLNFAKKCCNIKVFVHISTAYVCGEANNGEEILQEKPFEMGQTLKGTSKLNIQTEMDLLEKKIDELRAMNADESTIKYALKDYGIQRANLHGWPNTYVFTKAMGEMLVVNQKDNVPLIIIRPTMVTSTNKDPFPGWIEGLRTTDTVIRGYGIGKLACFVGNPNTILDIIPADLVINCVITTIVVHLDQAPKDFIYHISSSLRNPFKVLDFINIIYDYFVKNPCTNENGKPIVISKRLFPTSLSGFNVYLTIRYVIPLKVSNYVNKTCFRFSQDATYDDNYKKNRMLKGWAKLYKPYSCFKAM
ncbi:probable fatty acyl-CoA reductase 4 [Medicago truncatula]|uniref:probable fatty acyl-CoA reductase 4 n=1 Tax=Medicago truncatula TaxID=3880 RepID=UPI0019674462|nr:probable fatty acyl-CoA reductase 4 [Medicago truncatula]